ncbi:MAG: HAMP domain-containing histidine kinase [Candidatus Eremiobacteraeota bacterium]|nr:HAMP domain-containing histidine kinase [Candidatus Eremiobacteraeota bacterium]MBC5802539.1 HAMP domain-containing histidine kinase [Candidatus Eremiobacteraeota bacterium]MBC5822749.1 HAMP domain-containing histidine kinase [Candidatus Eremiobacteraeota bacterium]
MSVSQDARELERRLNLAYLTAFAIVLVTFAVAVHLAFTLDFRHEERVRLDVLSAQALAAYDMHDGQLHIDTDGPELSDSHLEGAAWYSPSGRLLAHAGTLPDLERSPVAGAERHTARFWSRDVPSAHGYVRVAVVTARDAHSLARDDLGLGIGLLIALIAASFGGRYLASRAIVRIVASMRTLRDFTADAAHELRGPLTALRSNADASLRDGSALPEAHRHRLDTIGATARDMTRTVEDLLLIARAETPLERELFAVDLDERIAKAAEARRALATHKGVALQSQPCGRARVYGDPSEIDRILGNLIDNAIRFTPAGGQVDVRCTPERGGFAVRVRDTGVGIPGEDLAKIFERFWRGDPVRRQDTGSGLGLAIVRALVRRHGGEVNARSTPGRGSEFAVWLPAQPPRPQLR